MFRKKKIVIIKRLMSIKFLIKPLRQLRDSKIGKEMPSKAKI